MVEILFELICWCNFMLRGGNGKMGIFFKGLRISERRWVRIEKFVYLVGNFILIFFVKVLFFLDLFKVDGKKSLWI